MTDEQKATMKVKELLRLLDKADPEDLVILSSDELGNSYHTVGAVNVSDYAYNGTWSEIGLRKLTTKLKNVGYDEDDLAPKSAKPCVVLWP